MCLKEIQVPTKTTTIFSEMGLTSTMHDEGPFGKNRTAPLSLDISIYQDSDFNLCELKYQYSNIKDINIHISYTSYWWLVFAREKLGELRQV